MTLGVAPVLATVNEVQGGPTAAAFQVYLTGPAAHDTLVSYAVTAPGAGFLGAAAFGGALPSGTVLIGQGQTSATVTLAVPAAAFGTEFERPASADGDADGRDGGVRADGAGAADQPQPGARARGLGADRGDAGRRDVHADRQYHLLDLGTLAANSGTIPLRFAVQNLGGALSDGLSGTFSASGSSSFTLSNFGSFGPIAGQGEYGSPSIVFSTAQSGVQTETITLTPTDSNGTGYSAALPVQTLTITANVMAPPPPVIAAPATLTTIQFLPMQVAGLAVSDGNAPGQPLTVTVAAGHGTLSTAETGSLAIAGNGTAMVTLSGSLSDVNAALAALTYSSVVAGPDVITVNAADAVRAVATQTVAVTTAELPMTAPILESPGVSWSRGRTTGSAGSRSSIPTHRPRGSRSRSRCRR